MDINNITIIGRLTRDADVAYTTSGTAVAKLSLAVNHMKKEEVSFFEVKAFGKLAENLKPYLLKGKQIAIGGYLKQERWEKDGQKFSKNNIIADSIELLGGNKSEGNSNGYGDSQDYGYGN
jgi:single-strand DNA-binding protein